jgi:hypothetical protein
MTLPALKGILRVGRDVLIIVLITGALGEVGLRIYNSIDPLPIFYSGNPDRFRGKPFASFWNFNLNSRGFNDVEFSTHKPQEQFALSALEIASPLASYHTNTIT